jgi:uncharacterized protein YicC (UPF0701 family)
MVEIVEVAADCLEVVEEIVRHQSIVTKLVKSLKKCLCKGKSSSGSGEEGDESVCEVLIEEMNELCAGKEEEGYKWSAKDKSRWRSLAKKLVKLGEWNPEALKDTPWKIISVTKPRRNVFASK